MSNTTPLGWEVSSLDQVFSEIKNGCSIDQNTSGDGIPVTRIETISQEKIDYSKVGWVKTTDDIDRFKIEKYDILLSHINSLKHIGKTAIKEDDRRLYHGMNLLRLKVCKSKFDPVYIHNLLSWEVVREEMRRKAKQAINQASLNVQDIKSLTYVLPPLPEQQKIATILSSVDDVIEKTRAQIDKLKDLKTGMMQELLTKGIGHTEFKDSPVGQIPLSWNVVAFSETGKWKGGGTPSKANPSFWKGDIPWVSPKDMKSEFIKKTEDCITQTAVAESSTNIVVAGSILIVVRSGILKHTLPVAIASVDLTLNQDMKALTVNESFSALYIYQYLLANNHKVLHATLKAGNTVESLDFTEFSNYLIPYPSLEEQHKIANVVESIAKRVRAKEAILESYEASKKALMQDLLTGKVRVKPNKSAAL